MKSIPKYEFYKSKYGEELLIDVVTLHSIKKYIDKHPVHTLSYFDITFISGGTGNFAIDNEPFSLTQGDVIFSKPGEIRVWDTTEIPQGYALIFEEEFLLSFFNDSSFIQNLSYFNPKRSSSKINISSVYTRIENLICTISDEVNCQQSRDKHILRALLYEILMVLNREYSKSCVTAVEEKTGNRHVNRFITLVDEHFKKCHLTKFYADELCITPNYLNEIVQTNMGTNAKSYIRDRIIREAKRLLSYTNLSVTEIAEELNFESPSYFIRLFRKQTNRTPLQFRQDTNR